MTLVHSIPSGELLHRGGEASLYRVTSESGKLYTLKLYTPGNNYSRHVIETLAKKAGGNLFPGENDRTKAHAGIYRIEEYGTVGENAYILYDYIDGVSSRALSPLPLEFALHSLRQVAITLAELQKEGISHGDINPDNVFFDKCGTPVLIDFGICGPGAPKFSAPERLNGNDPSERADLFSLGALFFFWITGEPLFDAPDFDGIREKIRDADKVNPGEILYGKISAGLDISPEALSLLDPIWKGVFAVNPDRRLENMEELDELLEIAQESLGGQGVKLARQSEGLAEAISGILKKNGTKALENVNFPFFSKKKEKKPSGKRLLFAIAVFIFLAIAAFLVLFPKSETPSIDDTGADLLQKSRSHEMEMQDTVQMPDLKNVLKKLAPEESEE